MANRINQLITGLILFVAIFYIIGLEKLPIGYDEGGFATGAKIILNGGQIYKDFFEYRTPGIYYLTSAFFAMFGDSLFLLRIFIVLITLFSVFVFYKIVKKMDGKRTALLTSLLILTAKPFLDTNVMVLTEGITMAFTIFALYFLLYKKPKSRDYFLAGILLGISFLFKQTALVAILAIILFLLYKRRVKETLYLAIPSAAIMLLFFAVFSYVDIFYYLFTFGSQILTMEAFTKIRVWFWFLFPVIWLGYAYLIRETIHKRITLMSIIAIFIILCLLPLREIWGHSFTQVLFFMAYFASKAGLELFRMKNRIVTMVVLLLILASLVIFVQSSVTAKVSCYFNNSQCSDLRNAQYATVDYLKGKDGSIFADTPLFYYMLDKKMPYYTFGIVGAPVSVFGLSDLVPTLEQNRTDYLIFAKSIYTEKVTSYNIIEYVQEKYDLVFEKDPYMVFKRR
jgi:4-amino-4-deoxy-L-arabinose transferase-like glycosyltransferase